MSSANVQIITLAAAGAVNCVRLANSTIVRGFSIDPDWTKLSIGLWHAFETGSSASISGTPRLSFGLCSGGVNVLGDPTPDHFVGYQTNTATITFASSSTYTSTYYAYSAGRYLKNVGGVETATGDPVTTAYHINTSEGDGWPSSKSNPYYLHITKGSPNYTFQIYYSNNPASPGFGNITEDVFMRELQSNTPSFAATEYTATAGTALTLAVDESADGVLDHVCVSWDRENPNSELLVYGLGVAVLA